MSTLIKNVLGTRAGYGLTVVRILVGIIFAAHGSQKLFGWFGGGGLAGTAQWMESIGLAPGYLMALLSGLRRPGADHRFAGPSCGPGPDLHPGGGDLLGAYQQWLVHGQQWLRIRPGAARRYPGGADRRGRQTLVGCVHRQVILAVDPGGRSSCDCPGSSACKNVPRPADAGLFSSCWNLDTDRPASLGCCSCADLNSYLRGARQAESLLPEASPASKYR